MATITNCLEQGLEWQHRAVARLKELRVFGDAPESELACLVAEATEERSAPGTTVANEGESFHSFLVLISGNIRIQKKDTKGNFLWNKVMSAPSFFGEVPLLSGLPSQMSVSAESEVYYLRVEEAGFWSLMSRCEALRAEILREVRVRTRSMQQQQTQQEKLAMLGTMTAGLMHELNNPGAAARRAASQLRANLQRMHEIARSFSERGHTTDQRQCLTTLQEQALSVRADRCMSSLQQTDAEEEMGSWLDEHAIAKAWEFAPVLVSSGISTENLDCLAHVFGTAELTEPLEWLEATASSMQMVGLVEDSVARVTELAQAVKSYAHEGQGGAQDLNVNESIHATVVMMKHKLREKNIRMQKEFGAGLPILHCVCSGLNQVWTNLLDNAIDAVPAEGGAIGIRTLKTGDEVQVVITDNGSGISPENRERIFDPFFTTKAQGVGTGLGMGIVMKILETYQGRLTLESEPGHTEFVVHIPLHPAD